jgi:hypothetical protein
MFFLETGRKEINKKRSFQTSHGHFSGPGEAGQFVGAFGRYWPVKSINFRHCTGKRPEKTIKDLTILGANFKIIPINTANDRRFPASFAASMYYS